MTFFVAAPSTPSQKQTPGRLEGCKQVDKRDGQTGQSSETGHRTVRSIEAGLVG